MRESLSPSPEQPQGSGLDLKGLIKTYGPMAAALAAGIILARGGKAQELGNILKKFAPEHFAKANKSPFPYMLDTVESKLGPTFRMAERPRFDPRRPDDLINFILGGKDSYDPSRFEAAGQHLGKVPQHMGILNVPESGRGTLSAGMHEFGHLSGFERAREQFPSANPFKSFWLGAPHQDIMGDPKTQAIIRSGLKDPKLSEYFAGRLSDTGTNTRGRPHMALGELLTELWAKRMLQRGGGQYESVTDLPIWGATSRRLAETPGVWDIVNETRRTGILPGPHEVTRQGALQQLLQELKASRPPAAQP